MEHYPGHLIMGIAALAATLLVASATVNRLIKRKVKLSVLLFGLYILANIVVAVQGAITGHAPGAGGSVDAQLRSFEQLAFAAAFINLLVVVLINPLRVDRVPDGFPSILQDTIVIGILVLVATFVFEDKLLTTSAVGAVVVGFALQDTLGNAFAGLAIQSEKPFRVGNWIRVGDFEGRVAEVTWRATKLRTKTGNFVVVPNNIVAQQAITNYSEPAVPTRLELEVGASYLSTPGEVKSAVLEALGQVPRVLKAPAPDALLQTFDGSAISYRVRFWVEDYELDDETRDEVRTAIYYAFGRRGIEIPWPIQVGYDRQWQDPDLAAHQAERERILGNVDLFMQLTGEQRRGIAAATTTRMFGNGEAIVRQGTAGDSMFVVCSGQVGVVLEPEQTEVATIHAGGYFGEMSLLTGDPRTATVVARGDAVVLEIGAGLFHAIGASDPQAIEKIAVSAMTRRAELAQIRETIKNAAVAEAPATLIARMRKFLRL
jgi:small-conductance mechanosensitive channel/CRP-like cAMP-binding protein